MGHVIARVTISSPVDESLQTRVDALVDTGATFSVVPRAIGLDLHLPTTGRVRVRTANGDVELERSRALIRIGEREEISPVLISDSPDRMLIGVITLESLALTVDPTTGQLNEMELLLY